MYEEIKQFFQTTFHREARYLFSAPGRTELSGNHTDHQLGKVLAGAVDLDTIAAVAPNGEPVIRVQSEGYPRCVIELDDLAVHPAETGTTAALIRGTAAGIAAHGFSVPGFDACVTSRVLAGSGLSSSAAFEVLLGTILNHLTQAGLNALEIARIGQYAENVYFGKPCGLLDQAASSLGGVITIDFADEKAPAVERLELDLTAYGYALCIVDSGADHADLTDEYAAIPGELRAINTHFGKTHLREVPEEDFYAALPALRREAGDRAVLRAIHVYEENRRVTEQVAALKRGDFDRFLELVKASGRSSWMYLQNVIPAGYKAHQDLAVALALAEKLLGGRGACRVHGGGFAGTIQAFVPLDMLARFRSEMDAALGEGSCLVLSIRSAGGILLEVL
ncbi:MAG: galactokinase family protein [Eubacteriales bacterium]|nr:galactokinase family protein [Eubacteriales bacterium]